MSSSLFEKNIKILEVTIPSFDAALFRLVFKNESELSRSFFSKYKIKTVTLTKAVQSYFNFL